MVDQKTDLNPQALALDQTGCVNIVRHQYPIVHIDEGGIIAGRLLLGAAGGAISGAASAAGTGQAGQATATNAVGGFAQGTVNGLDQIQNIYKAQALRQGTHYALCLAQHGHAVTAASEAELEQAARTVDTPGGRL